MKPKILFRPSNPRDYEWFTGQTHLRPGPGFKGVVAYGADGKQMGMVGMDSWTPNSVQMHWAIRYPRCIRALWKEVCKFLVDNGRELIIGVQPSDNFASLKTQKHLGWTEGYRIKDGWSDGIDLVVTEYRLLGSTNDG